MKYVDLHLHLDGSLPPETVLKLAKMSAYPLPADTVEGLLPFLTVDPDCHDLNEYLEKFQLPIALLQTEESLRTAVYDVLEMISGQGVVYAEIRFAPEVHCAGGLTQDQVIAAAVAGLEQGMQAFPIRAQLICCCMRGPEYHDRNLETVRTAAHWLGRGVCSVDLAGAEALFPTQDHADIFAEARRLEVPSTIHAGEAAGPESVWDALELGARRIGHGVAAAQDPALLERIRRDQIPLEVCVTSNIQTRAFPELAQHPIRTLLEQGIPVTLNTDNMTVSGTTLPREFALVTQAFSLTPAQIRQLQRNAVDAAFLPAEEKRLLWEQIAQDDIQSP